MRILVFAGTSEARKLCRAAVIRGFDVTASVATEYGKSLLLEDGALAGRLSVRSGRLSEREMEGIVGGFDAVVDATHPFAVEATRNIRAACESRSVPLVRFRRETRFCADGMEVFPSISGAADFIARGDEKRLCAGERLPRVFLSTGAKDLSPFTRLRDFASRVFVRVLPSAESIGKCTSLGFRAKNIIAMHGPFSEPLNEAMFRETGAEILVTKVSGKNGGFDEKIAAARACAMRVLAVSPPEEVAFFSDADALLSALGRSA